MIKGWRDRIDEMDGGIGFLTKNSLFKACSVNHIDSNIEIVFINVREKHNEKLNTFAFYEKQESRTTEQKEAITEFAELETIINKYSTKKCRISLTRVLNADISNNLEK